jgi:hypothetical protein
VSGSRLFSGLHSRTTPNRRIFASAKNDAISAVTNRGRDTVWDVRLIP